MSVRIADDEQRSDRPRAGHFTTWETDGVLRNPRRVPRMGLAGHGTEARSEEEPTPVHIAEQMGATRPPGPGHALVARLGLAAGLTLLWVSPALGVTPAQDGPRVVDRIVAVVNGEVITMGQLERRVLLQDAPAILTGGTCQADLAGDASALSAGEPGGSGSPPPGAAGGPTGPGAATTPEPTGTPVASPDGNRREVLQQLIDRLLVLQHVRRFPQPGVTPERVNEEMETLVACFESPAAFEAELERWGRSRTAVRRDLEQQLMVNSYVQGRFGSIVEISDGEIRTYYRETLVPEMARRNAPVPELEAVAPRIRQILEQQEINRRQEQWIDGLRARAEITVYIW